MVTTDSDWGTLKLVLAVGWGTNWPFYSVIFLIITNEFGILETLFNIKWKNNWLKFWRHDNLSIFEKLWLYSYKYAEICKISPNLVCNEDKLKKINTVGSWMKISNVRLKAFCIFILERSEFQKMLIKHRTRVEI